MQMCMLGYNIFDMDTLRPGKPDPGINKLCIKAIFHSLLKGLKQQIFEPTFWSEEDKAMILSPNVEYVDDVKCEESNCGDKTVLTRVVDTSLHRWPNECIISLITDCTNIVSNIQTLYCGEI